ncbi:MAG: D-glycero-beta-D-manno-heptose-7-phosphate kinase [candidate division Zixibacteria bacterium]|nr:D-glycero-beta-D-manno-heptose-7-phosphate kinase [candidate division Zixibacteria bacterium]
MNESLHVQIEDLLTRFGSARVVVLGDVMLDEYWWGSVDRISPEAPVPVVSVERKGTKLGGAANVSLNVRSLGGSVKTVSVVGADAAGETLKSLLRDKGLPDDGVIVTADRPTTVKTRIVAHHQQIVRADIETTEEIHTSLLEKVWAAYLDAMRDASGVIISDYGKGIINGTLLPRVIDWARSNSRFVVVDPKETHFFAYRNVTTLTPNHHEAGFVAGRRLRDDAAVRSVGFELLQRLGSDSLLITLGERGMALFEPPDRLTTIPTVADKVFDVTGAGDTVIATVAMCLASGGTMLQAAYTANLAAGQVIKEVGTSQTTVEAIRHAVGQIPSPIFHTSQGHATA